MQFLQGEKGQISTTDTFKQARQKTLYGYEVFLRMSGRGGVYVCVNQCDRHYKGLEKFATFVLLGMLLKENVG